MILPQSTNVSHLLSEPGCRVSERRLQWRVDPYQVRPYQCGRDPVHVFGHQRGASRRGRVHQQRRPGSPRASAERQNQRLEEHVGREDDCDQLPE